jgi:hypothetical protein
MFLVSPFDFSPALSFCYLRKAAVICHKKLRQIIEADEIHKFTPENTPERALESGC